ncbi:MAG: type II toxin-antitoxin system RelE/ParE family toxin [Taibaiella sp.]|nr:type II toxin-antitoxin system RelE/ParE family toxin [Taibaiella sp.]
MAYKVVVKKRFITKLSRILKYLEMEWGEKVALEFAKKVDARIDSLEHHPYIGAPTNKHADTRGLYITKHNRLFYKIKGKAVVVLNIYDTRQKHYR